MYRWSTRVLVPLPSEKTRMPAQHYCLRWKNHHSNVQNMFTQLLEKDRFCDVRILCGGVTLRAHRAVLASCSALLSSLLTGGGVHGDDPPDAGDTVLVVDGAEPEDVTALLRYMYTGEISVHHTQLTSLLKTAEELRIKGLAEIRWAGGPSGHDMETSIHQSNVPETPNHEREGGLNSGRRADTHSSSKTKSDKVEDKMSSKKDDSEKPNDLSNSDSAATRANGKHDEERTLVIPSSCSVINGGPPPLRWITEKTQTSTVSCQTEDEKKRSLQGNGNANEPPTSPKRMKTEAQKILTDSKWKSSPHKYGNNVDAINTREIKTEPQLNLDGVETGYIAGDSDEEDYDGSAHDISQFLDTSFREGDDDMSGDGCELLPTAHNRLSPAPGQSNSLAGSSLSGQYHNSNLTTHSTSLKVDPRYRDVIKLNDYLRNGRRQQFWEQDYVLRVMEGVRSKDLEMKQAAEILGVSYGTLYGRYRDVYGCINRPYSSTHSRSRDFWTEQGGSEILLRLRRGEIPVTSAAEALGVTPSVLAAYVTKLGEASGSFSDEGETTREIAQTTISSAAQQPTERSSRPPRILPPATLNANYAASLANAQRHVQISQRTSDDTDPLSSVSNIPSPPSLSVSPSPSLPLHMGRRGRQRYIHGPSPLNTNYVPIAPAAVPSTPVAPPSSKVVRRNIAAAEASLRKVITTYENKPFRMVELDTYTGKDDETDLIGGSSQLDANVSILRSRPELTIVPSGKKDTTPGSSGLGNVT